MPAKNPLSISLNDDDIILFEKAAQLHGIGKSELAREIISNWLFNNKLQLMAK